MRKLTNLMRPYWVILGIFLVIRIVLSNQGVPYANPRAAAVSIITLTFVASALTAALGRGLLNLSLKEAAIMGLLMGFSAQVVIFSMTMISLLGGFSTYFTYPGAINDALPLDQPVTMAVALPARLQGLVFGPIPAAITAAIGWAIGGLMGGKE